MAGETQMEPDTRRATRMLADLDEERGMIIQWEMLNVSIRQVLLILAALSVYVMLIQATGWLLPLPGFLCGLIWVWLPIGGIVLAMWKKNDLPLEYYLTDMIIFHISDRHFRPMDEKRSSQRNAENAQWEEAETPYWS